MDQDLVVRAQRGDQRAFESLAAACHPRLYRLAQGILGSPVAYSDLKGTTGYQSDGADVLIAMLVDTDHNGVDRGDQIVMGRYPTNFAASAFGDWGIDSRTATSVHNTTPPLMEVKTNADADLHTWIRAVRSEGSEAELYGEGPESSVFTDAHGGLAGDHILARPGSPSQPDTTGIDISRSNSEDDDFIDVDINY